MITSIFWWIGLLLLTIVSRWWVRIVRPHALGDDTYYHLTHAELIRENRFRLHESVPQFILPASYIYPPLYHYFLALFNKSTRYRIERLSSALSDSLLVILFVWCANEVLLPLSWSEGQIMILAVTFALSPALTAGMGTGPRAYQGTPRTVAELLAAVAFVCFWLYWTQQSMLWLSAGIIFATLLLLCSKFGAQVLVFFCLILSFMLNSATILLIPVFSFVTAIIVSNGRYWNVVTAQVQHLHLYATKIVPTHPMLLWRKQLYWPRTIREAYEFFLYKSPLGVFFSKFYSFLIAVILLFWHTRGGSVVDEFLVTWMAAALIMFIIVATPKFLFIGAAERYLEYGLIPAFLILGVGLTDFAYWNGMLIGLMLISIGLYIMNALLFIGRYEQRAFHLQNELVSALKSAPRGVILSILGSAPWMLAYQTKHKVLFGTVSLISPEQYSELFWRFPLPNKDLSLYAEQYNVTLIPASKQVVENARRDGCHYHFDGFQPIFENESYILYHKTAN